MTNICPGCGCYRNTLHEMRCWYRDVLDLRLRMKPQRTGAESWRNRIFSRLPSWEQIEADALSTGLLNLAFATRSLRINREEIGTDTSYTITRPVFWVTT